MEYEKYEVIGEEKLSDIAKKYNISPEKIKEANPNARFFKTFFGTSEIVECLQTLKIPVERKIEKKQGITHSESENFNFITSQREKEEKLKEYTSVEFNLGKFEEKHFVSNHLTEIHVNGGKMATYTQFQKFILQLLETGSRFKYKLDVSENNFEDGFNLKEQFDGLLEKIVHLKDKLELYLNKFGKLEDVANKEVLRKKWEELKTELKENPKLKEIPQDKFKEMLQKGDYEFSNSYPLAKDLQKSVFHSHLFYPLYNQKFYIGVPNQLGSNWMMSTLFSELEIPLTSVLNISDDEENNEYIIKIESQLNKSALSRIDIKNAYEKHYPFLKEQFLKYNVNIDCFYAINKEDFHINYAEIEIEELVNSNLEAYQKLEIERVEQEEPKQENDE